MRETRKYYSTFIEVIDFDEASKAWRQNKNCLKNGMFTYKKSKLNCQHKKDSCKCRKKCVIGENYCENHFN